MPYSYMYSYGIEWVLIILSLIITFGAQAYINSAYKKNKKIDTKKGLTGKEVARKILDKNGLKNVEVVETTGILSDHYDPRTKVVRLSSDIFSESSIAASSVAAHECGHAIQDKDGYAFLKFRNAIIPFVNISSTLGYVAIMIGLLLGALGFLWIGIALDCVILLFQLITLPVEFNASRRGLKQLQELDLVDSKELSNSRSMLTAAALTYVASVTATLLEIIRLLLIAKGRERRR